MFSTSASRLTPDNRSNSDNDKYTDNNSDKEIIIAMTFQVQYHL